MGNLSELASKILQKAKTVFLLPEDATEAELHQAITESSEDLKTDLVMGFASQLSELVQAETDKQVAEFTAKLKEESAEVISILETKLSDLETKLSEIKIPDVEATDKKIADLRTEFANELNKIKAVDYKASLAGDGTVISKHESNGSPLPTKAFNIIRA